MTLLTRSGRAPCVAIVAPSSAAPDPSVLPRAEARLAAAGCRVKWFTRPEERMTRFAATDEQRLAGLMAAADDPEVDIVMALRGGYGVSRLLPRIDAARLAASGKLFVGHSDFTPLHLMLLQHGAASFSGPMVCDDFTAEEASAFTHDSFWQCLRGPQHEIAWQAEGNPDVQAGGMLWGGNLSMLCHMLGSPWLPDVDGGILFIEDIAEHPFRVERMLLQLLHAGILGRQRALVIGDLSGYRLGTIDQGYDLPDMLAHIRAKAGIPVITGLPFGHIRAKATLAVGSQARLESRNGAASLLMEAYPTL